MITNLDQLDLEKTYSYTDYLSWKFSERAELLWGKIYKMLPAPPTNNQRISGILHRDIANFLIDSQCEVFHAPFDVYLNIHAQKLHSVVQPDNVVICDVSKLDE